MKVLLFKTVTVGVKPEESGALPFSGPKNHSKVGVGILGSGKGEFLLGKRVAEHVSE